uniref:Dirigent protein n=1 Tax=Oryza barthii TaxID=65489 RepID=A0A0D3GU11_9ORYZ
MASLMIVAAIFLLSLTSASVVHGRSSRRRFVRSYDEPVTTQATWSKASLIVAAIFLVAGLLLSSATVVHGGGGGRRFVRSYDEPCKEMRLYFHDILYDFSNSTANSTSAVVASPAALLRAAKNTTIFGTTVVFNDPMTEGTSALPPSLEETAVRAQGLYLYDGKAASTLNAWLAFSVVFNSTARRGTLSLMGADPSTATRDISVVGGTGDFFMSRGVATLRADAVEGFTYFRLLMDIKLYECYI